MAVENLFDGMKYNIDNGPLIEDLDKVYQGVNCQLTAHILLEELGLALPKWMRSKEIFEDRQFVKPINYPWESLRVGDILLFAPEKEQDAKKFHLAVVVDFDSSSVPLLQHAVAFKDKSKDAVVIWPLTKMLASRRYEELKGVRRVATSSEREAMNRLLVNGVLMQ